MTVMMKGTGIVMEDDVADQNRTWVANFEMMTESEMKQRGNGQQ